MEVFGILIRQILNISIPFFEYQVTVGQFIFFVSLASILVVFINGVFD